MHSLLPALGGPLGGPAGGLVLGACLGTGKLLASLVHARPVASSAARCGAAAAKPALSGEIKTAQVKINGREVQVAGARPRIKGL